MNYKTRAEKYIDRNTNTLLKEALNYYETALSKAVWGRDLEVRKSIQAEIDYIQNKILEWYIIKRLFSCGEYWLFAAVFLFFSIYQNNCIFSFNLGYILYLIHIFFNIKF